MLFINAEILPIAFLLLSLMIRDRIIKKSTEVIIMSEYGKRAEELFTDGYNCAQAVLCAFEDVTGMERSTAAAVASSFGGGIGRMREVCGAVSGAVMVLGIAKGYTDPKDPVSKRNHYRLVQEFMRRFREENGSYICRELLSGVDSTKGGDPEERTPQYYKKRPCRELVGCAADIAAEMLAL